MAKAVGKKASAGGRRGPKVLLVLVGFVLVAVGVNLRRVHGHKESLVIREMEVKREALVSEQLKLQDAIRVASDRQHIIGVAQSRLGMKMPDLNQVIDLPRRPLAPRRDSLGQ
jgi:cell division protein FtsL